MDVFVSSLCMMRFVSLHGAFFYIILIVQELCCMLKRWSMRSSSVSCGTYCCGSSSPPSRHALGVTCLDVQGAILGSPPQPCKRGKAYPEAMSKLGHQLG